MNNERIKKIYNLLINNYYNYYCTVYYSFIIEAIENTLEDNKNRDLSIEEIHKYIKENFI